MDAFSFVVIIHVLSAVMWVGGSLFLSFVVIPVTRHLDPSVRTPLMTAVGRRFRVVGWWSLGILWLTGIVQVALRGFTFVSIANGSFFASKFGRLLTLKLSLVVLMMLIGVIHDHVAGSLLKQAMERGGNVSRYRQQATWLGRLSLLIAMTIAGIAVVMVR